MNKKKRKIPISFLKIGKDIGNSFSKELLYAVCGFIIYYRVVRFKTSKIF